MAYELHYTIEFNSPITEAVRVELYKDATPEAVVELTGIQFKQDYLNGKGDKFEKIIACEVTIVFQIDRGSELSYADFIISDPTEWKVVAYIDDVIVFIGFVTPGEGRSEFQDPPYDISLSAIDGLGLLKDIALSDINGDNFDDTNFVKDYIAGALQKTGLDLNFLLFCNIYESSMTDRFADEEKDAFNQAKLEYRTFLKDPVTFVDCYTALERILGEHFSLYQWNGRWAILRIAEMQDNPGPQIYHTEYDYQGTVVGASQYEFGPCQVGKDAVLHPINRSNFISSRFAIKSARHEFKYEIWPEVPKNNRFERGTKSFPLSGPDYEAFFVDDWTTGTNNGTLAQFDALPVFITANPDNWYRKSTYNAFGIEILREILIENISNSPSGARWVQSDGIPCNAGDKIDLSFDVKYSTAVSENPAVCAVYIIEDGTGDLYSLAQGVGQFQEVPTWRLDAAPVLDALYIDTNSSNGDGSIYSNFSLTSNVLLEKLEPIPVTGTMYIVLMHVLPSYNNVMHIKNFTFDYYLFIAGGFRQVDGDYWLTSQVANFKDSVDQQVYLSDSPKKILKGSLLRSDGTTLTTPSWYRLNKSEERHYKELLNLGWYNHAYRRMWKLEGDLGGTRFNAVDNPVVNEPLSFHKHFYFKDAPELGGIYFMLVPPLSIDYTLGETNATFVEVLNSNLTSEGAQTAGQIAQLLIQEINDTFSGLTFAQSHTDPDKLIVYTVDANSVSAAANDNGVGNSPSLTIISTTNLPGPTKQIIIQVGADIQPTNSFTVTIAGTPATVVSTSLVTYEDGNQEGDTHEFKYVFQ